MMNKLLACMAGLLLCGCIHRPPVVEPSNEETPKSVIENFYKGWKTVILSEYGISLKLPPSYRLENAHPFYYVKKDPEPMPEMTLEITPLVKDAKPDAKAEKIQIGGLHGFKSYYSLEEHPGSRCPHYELSNDRWTFVFDLWECLEFEHFEKIVQSVKVQKK